MSDGNHRPRSSASEASERRMELLIGIMLRWGVLLSAAIVLIGGVAFVARHGNAPPTVHDFTGEPPEFRSIPGIVNGSLARHGRAIIAFGLFVLLATPVARVALTLIAFLRQRDWTFVAITAFVLGTLVSTLGRLL